MILINAFIAKLNNSCIIICLYADDLLIFETNLQIVIDIKSFQRSKFDMKDLG